MKTLNKFTKPKKVSLLFKSKNKQKIQINLLKEEFG
jgi:hypothetical protein